MPIDPVIDYSVLGEVAADRAAQVGLQYAPERTFCHGNHFYSYCHHPDGTIEAVPANYGGIGVMWTGGARRNIVTLVEATPAPAPTPDAPAVAAGAEDLPPGAYMVDGVIHVRSLDDVEGTIDGACIGNSSTMYCSTTDGRRYAIPAGFGSAPGTAPAPISVHEWGTGN